MKKNIRILLLGQTGLLGNKVYTELKKNKKFTLLKTQRSNKFSSNYLNVIDNPNKISLILDKNKDIDYVINCIGITQSELKKYNSEESKILARKINTEFPKILCKETKLRNINVIHISTDAVFSGKNGPYSELDQADSIDLYGESKFFGECHEKNFLNLRCSIIGPDKVKKNGLFEWFRSLENKSTINGFTNHFWNGITTQQFANICSLIIEKNIFSNITNIAFIHHISINKTISKYELLKMFNEILCKNIKIEAINDDQYINRILLSKYECINNVYIKSFNKSSWIELIKEMI